MNESVRQLFHTLTAATSPFHIVQEGIRQLEEAGFTQLHMNQEWSLNPGDRRYVNVYGTTLFAFKVNPGVNFHQSFRIAAAHTDWPCLRIKANPDMKSGTYAKLNTEVYGGPIYNTWLDRPLSIAGRVALKGEDVFHPQMRLIDFQRPLLTLPNLAIHMNREVNQGAALNQQIDLLPLMGVFPEEKEGAEVLKFASVLAKELQVKPEDILSFDLYVYCCESPALCGADKSMISSPRLDNVTSCQACLNGIINGDRAEGYDVIALFDNEEVGSKTKQGADSVQLSWLLEKILCGMGRGRSQYLTAAADSFLLSVDVAHAVHPNHIEKCDPVNQLTLRGEVAVKLSTNQRYATDGQAIAIIEGICRKNNIPYGEFTNRSDIPGGGTLGSLSSSWLPVLAADIGIPMLAMHSARELCGRDSQRNLNHLLEAYFTET